MVTPCLKKLCNIFLLDNICCICPRYAVISIYHFGYKENTMTVTSRIVIPDKSITVFLDGQRFSITSDNKLFAQAFQAYKEENWDAFVGYVNPEIRLKSLYASYEGIEVKDGNLFVFGDAVHSTLATRVMSFLEHDLDCVHLFKFILKLNLNPSKRAVDELYTFLEHKELPITDNGNFIAYKAVRDNYTDKHTGKFLNTVGSVLEMPRNKVDDDKNVGCSYGFHAGTKEYATDFAYGEGHIMEVEINPADVVSIPTDCNFQKLRTCKYKVVAEHELPLTSPVYASRFETDQDDDVDVWSSDEEENNLCSGCNWECESWCMDCEQCGDCCDCGDLPSDDEDLDDATLKQPKTEIQLQLNLDNKMTTNWANERFQYLVMLSWLYAHQRPAVANALRRFYKDVDDQHKIIPVFAVLKQFTSDEDAYKIYAEYTNHK